MYNSQCPSPLAAPPPGKDRVGRPNIGRYLARLGGGASLHRDDQLNASGGIQLLHNRIQTIWRSLRIGRSDRKPEPGVVTTHDDITTGHLKVLDILFEQDTPTAGENSILRNAAAVSPPDVYAGLLVEARQKADASDWSAAITAWQRVAILFPGNQESAVGNAEAYRALGRFEDADCVLNAELERGGMTPSIAVGLALNAQGQARWADALSRWNNARNHFPDLAVIWAAETAILQILGRFEEADALANTATVNFPDNIDVTAQYLNVAIARQNWQQAQTRLDHLALYFPNHDYTHENIKKLARKISEGVKEEQSGFQDSHLPNILAGAIEADARKDWSTSAPLWELLHLHQPNDCSTVRGFGQALRESGRYDEADRILAGGIAQFPENVELRAHHAEVAASRKDWAEAAMRWQAILQQHDDMDALWPMAADAFVEVGWFDEATRLLSRGIAQEPDRIDLRVRHAKLAEKQDDWNGAVERWNTVLRLKPDDPNIQNSRGDAIWQRTISELEKGESAPNAADDRRSTSGGVPGLELDTLRELALKFEGLGDNCEFGIVQRRFGADPLGLFRFGAVGAEALIRLAEEAFRPLGDPAFIALGLTSGNEYLISDTRGHYHMHSFVQKGSVDEERFLMQQTRRLGFLKKKLIEDLTEAHKIFIYKSSVERISDDTLRALSEALRKFGNVTMLGIRQSDESHSPGYVEILDEHILVGYVSTLYNGEGSEIDFDAWKIILHASDRYKSEINSR